MGGTILANDHVFIRKIESIAQFDLSAEERKALVSLPMQVSQYDPGQDVVTERDRPSRCIAVLNGIAAGYKVTEEGRRQVVAYYVPGDVPDFLSLHLEVLDFSIGAVTPLRIGLVCHNAIKGMFGAYPRLKGAFWRATLIEGSLAREWLLNNGRRDAYARLAHLFCELMLRLDRVGLVFDHSCEFHLTQGELADAVGITPIHVSRMLKNLRANGLSTLKGGRLTIHNWDGLTKVAGFDPAYLHLRKYDL